MGVPIVFSILSVGNEILSGDIDNTNATYLAKRLTVSGHRVIRIVVVPDCVDDIAEELKRLKDTSDFVLVTGGLGVTIKNDVGCAPGFIIDNVLVMPGVPDEMKDIFSKVEDTFGCLPYSEERVRVEGFEDRIADLLSMLVEKYKDVEIGSYPKPGYIIVKFSGSDVESVKKAKEEFLRRLEERGIPYREMT